MSFKSALKYAVAPAAAIAAVPAAAQVTIPTEMAPDALVTEGLGALAPLIGPVLTMVAVIGLALGIVGFIWKVSKRGGRGG